MYHLYHTKNYIKPRENKDRKFNMMLIYFLSFTNPGYVIYKGNNKILIEKLFKDHIFTDNITETLPIYLVMDKYDEVLYNYYKPNAVMTKINIYEKFNFNYFIMFPPRMKEKNKRLYCISTNMPIYQKTFDINDIIKYHGIRMIKHTTNCKGLKSYCKCHDCWIEIEIIKKYICSENYKYTSYSRLHAVKTILKWLKKNIPIGRKYCY